MTAPGIGHRILELLDQHHPLAYEQIAARLNEPPDEVRGALSRLRGIGLVEASAAGEIHAHTMPVAHWQLTHEGRKEAARVRER
jgi:predicted ArsR family transcriptional regulator